MSKHPPCFRPFRWCERCGVNLRWAITPKGKLAPFEQTNAGIYVLVTDPDRGEVHAIKAGLAERRRYRIHAFCQAETE
jgi:hypothetical protein